MTLPIRARLTLWYSSVVLLVLATGAVISSVAQWRLAVQRLDDDLARSMATLQGVMRKEIDEGMTLEASSEEASIEVVVPDRTLVLTREDGNILQVWGLPLDRPSLPPLRREPEFVTVATPADELRVFSQFVEDRGHRYIAGVMAPLKVLRAQHAEMVRAMSVGVLMALVTAAVGGWFIGRQTLRPLTKMADQARRINERDPHARLTAPPVNDELSQLAGAFNGLLDRLASALSFQRQFMADASHELRTPVSVVRTATQVTLSKAVRTADEYRESLVIIGEQANRLSQLVDSMFFLSRAEAHGVPLQREFLNLDDIVMESVRAFRVLANQRGVNVTATGDEEASLAGDAGLLRRMVGNLFDDAIRHAAPRGQVAAELERSTDRVVLRITNDGPRIEPDDRDRIFERFVRIGGSDGAGLGLPIARWIAEAHGGRLQLDDSRPGCTTFSVTLPAEPAEPAQRVVVTARSA
jgi:heavy metal sensor kinase